MTTPTRDRTLEQVARARYAEQVAIGVAAGRAASNAWTDLDLADVRNSWIRLIGVRLLRQIEAAQLLVARTAHDYVDRAVATTRRRRGRQTPTRRPRLIPERLVGVAADGRPLPTLLYQPAVTTLRAIEAGRPVHEAAALGETQLDMLVRTTIADTGRTATGIEVAATPTLGYVRMLNPPSCSRCVILAGRFYRWNTGFQRHPRCLPAGVVVSGPAAAAATRRWYEGELVVITTAGGEQLPVTGNHPVLTDRGWLPANVVDEGDHVVRSTAGQGAVALTVPHEYQVPALIEDVWGAHGVVPFGQVPTAAEDFHGDGGHGDVDVVLTDGLLGYGVQAGELAEQVQLAWRVAEAALLAQFGASDEQVMGLLGSADRGMGGGGLVAALVGSLAAGAHGPGGGAAADLHAGLFEAAADHVAADAVAAAEAQLALAGAVRRREVGGRQDVFAARWDAPPDPFTVQGRAAYASRGRDLLLRLAGQVELDRVVERRRVGWSGHVYNLTSVEGWYAANGLIVSNCDCIHVPVTEDAADDLRTDPQQYFDSLSEAEQNRAFTADGAQAIRDGADLGRVVNARRGMYVAGGRQFTREGTRRRGARAARLMPEQIYREAAGNRAEAIRLLRLHGYIA